MTIYRVITRTPFSDGRIEGDLVCESDYAHDVLMKLLAKDKIAPVTGPPLSILPEWKLVAEKVVDIGIMDVIEFIEADPVEIMHVVGWKRDATVAKWKDKALALLTASSPLPRSRMSKG
jgi:hypothetical protein